MLAAILAVLQSLPALIKLAQEAFTFFKHLAGEDPQGYIKAWGEAVAQLNQSKTSEDRTNAALAIQKLINKL